jgi:hypothetical protein
VDGRAIAVEHEVPPWVHGAQGEGQLFAAATFEGSLTAKESAVMIYGGSEKQEFEVC